VEISPRKRDAELLVGLEVMTQRTDDRVVTVGRSWMNWVGVSKLGRLDHSRQTVERVSHADIDKHRIRKHEVGLQHGANLGANGFQGDVPQVMTVRLVTRPDCGSMRRGMRQASASLNLRPAT